MTKTKEMANFMDCDIAQVRRKQLHFLNRVSHMFTFKRRGRGAQELKRVTSHGQYQQSSQ